MNMSQCKDFRNSTSKYLFLKDFTYKVSELITKNKLTSVQARHLIDAAQAGLDAILAASTENMSELKQ